MAKVTIGEISYEGTPEEIKILMGEEEKQEATKPWVSAFSVGGFVKKDSEIEAARLKLELLKREALKEKWSKIGRKPNEFKFGDIVLYADELVVVTSVTKDSIYFFNKARKGFIDSSSSAPKSYFKLIAPVESLFKESE
jgi:hypothetical protein